MNTKKKELLPTRNLTSVRCWTGGGPGNSIWNWGDAISPEIYKLVAGSSPATIDYTDYTNEPHLIICGSTLKWANDDSVIWGTGEIAEGMKFRKPLSKPLNIAAVRGPLTRKRLVEAGISCPEIFGDPALLFSSFYTPDVEKKYELGVVPHYIDASLDVVKSFYSDKRVKVIDITQKNRSDKIYSFIDDVNECKRIASSSLHGLILADSYRIPSIWLEFSDKVFGKGFKFRDYLMSVKRPVLNPMQMMSGKVDVDSLMGRIDKYSHGIKFQCERLLRSFPN